MEKKIWGWVAGSWDPTRPAPSPPAQISTVSSPVICLRPFFSVSQEGPFFHTMLAAPLYRSGSAMKNSSSFGWTYTQRHTSAPRDIFFSIRKDPFGGEVEWTVFTVSYSSGSCLLPSFCWGIQSTYPVQTRTPSICLSVSGAVVSFFCRFAPWVVAFLLDPLLLEEWCLFSSIRVKSTDF